MKSNISGTFFAVLILSFISCKKSTLNDSNDAPAKLEASISHHITQPADTQLGEAASFKVGDKIVVYVPYKIEHDVLDTAYLVITDEQNQVVASMELLESINFEEDGLIVPEELQNADFLFASIDIEEYFANKKFNISIKVKGEKSSGTDKFDNAFSVAPYP